MEIHLLEINRLIFTIIKYKFKEYPTNPKRLQSKHSKNRSLTPPYKTNIPPPPEKAHKQQHTSTTTTTATTRIQQLEKSSTLIENKLIALLRTYIVA